jgi:polysaccharide export outer membrane protein
MVACAVVAPQPLAAQTARDRSAPAASADAAATRPPDYVIGCDDVLAVTFWKDKDMSAEVSVRPDGRITLPLLNDVVAAGLTPEQLRDRIAERAKRFMDEPNLTVTVKTINSRKVFITGQVAKPGPYPLIDRTTVLQLVSMAGGLTEFADRKSLIVLRAEHGRQVSYRVNYNELAKQINVAQNIYLQPSDTVIVP